ncbi:protease [Mucilaginibacter sp.]
MKHQFYAFLFSTAMVAAGCHTQKALTQTVRMNEYTIGAEKLAVKMSANVKALTRDSVPLTFTVTNNTNKPLKFCKWESPFEPRLGKYFDIMDAKGNEAAFRGAMARRMMPPPADAYMEVAAHKSVSTVINLAANYTLEPGKYTVKYTGGGISGLPAGETIELRVKN